MQKLKDRLRKWFTGRDTIRRENVCGICGRTKRSTEKWGDGKHYEETKDWIVIMGICNKCLSDMYDDVQTA